MDIQLAKSPLLKPRFDLPAALAAGTLVLWRERDVLVCQVDRIRGDIPQYFEMDLMVDGECLQNLAHILVSVHPTESLTTHAGERRITAWVGYAHYRDPASRWRPHRTTARVIQEETFRGEPDSIGIARALLRCQDAVGEDALEPVHAMLDRLHAEKSFCYRDVPVDYWANGHGDGSYLFCPHSANRLGGAFLVSATAQGARDAIDRAWCMAEIPCWGLDAAIQARLPVGEAFVLTGAARQGGEIARLVWQSEDLRVIQLENGALGLYAGAEATGYIGGAGSDPEVFVANVIARERMWAGTNTSAARDAALEGHDPLIL